VLSTPLLSVGSAGDLQCGRVLCGPRPAGLRQEHAYKHIGPQGPLHNHPLVMPTFIYYAQVGQPEGPCAHCADWQVHCAE
jgi:hypothetical protein